MGVLITHYTLEIKVQLVVGNRGQGSSRQHFFCKDRHDIGNQNGNKNLFEGLAPTPSPHLHFASNVNDKRATIGFSRNKSIKGFHRHRSIPIGYFNQTRCNIMLFKLTFAMHVTVKACKYTLGIYMYQYRTVYIKLFHFFG